MNTLTTSSAQETLCLRALLAYAARCARRVQPLYRLPANHSQAAIFQNAIDVAIGLAEEFAAGNSPNPETIAETSEQVIAALVLAGEVQTDDRRAAYAANTAYAVIDATHDALESIHSSEAVERVVASVRIAHDSAVSADPRVEAEADRDRERLEHLALGTFPETGNPVDSKEFGPLGSLFAGPRSPHSPASNSSSATDTSATDTSVTDALGADLSTADIPTDQTESANQTVADTVADTVANEENILTPPPLDASTKKFREWLQDFKRKRSQLAREREQIDTERLELSRQQEELEQQQSAWKQEQEKLSQAVSLLNEEHVEQQKRLQTEQQALQTEQQKITAAQQALKDERDAFQKQTDDLRDSAAEIEKTAAELEAQRTQLSEEHEQLQQQREQDRKHIQSLHDKLTQEIIQTQQLAQTQEITWRRDEHDEPASRLSPPVSVSATADCKTSAMRPLRMLLEPGLATEMQLAELFDALSMLYCQLGGPGVRFTVNESRTWTAPPQPNAPADAPVMVRCLVDLHGTPSELTDESFGDIDSAPWNRFLSSLLIPLSFHEELMAVYKLGQPADENYDAGQIVSVAAHRAATAYAAHNDSALANQTPENQTCEPGIDVVTRQLRHLETLLKRLADEQHLAIELASTNDETLREDSEEGEDASLPLPIAQRSNRWFSKAFRQTAIAVTVALLIAVLGWRFIG